MRKYHKNIRSLLHTKVPHTKKKLQLSKSDKWLTCSHKTNREETSCVQGHTLMTTYLQVAYNHLPPKELPNN